MNEESKDWIDWTGGPRPHPPTTNVEVRMRSGKIEAAPSAFFPWWHDGGERDILSYRIDTSIKPDENGWFPIEAAPKDGTIFDVWLGNIDESDRNFYCLDGTRRSTGWHYLNGKFRPFIDGVMATFVQPTHYRPLPQPPVNQEIDS